MSASKHLELDQIGVNARLRKAISASDADVRYNQLAGADGGKVISADVARFLAPEFATWYGRIRHTPSTGEPAGIYAHLRILRELRNRGRRRRLLVTAGGAGAGKSSQLSSLKSIADLVFDNQFRDRKRASEVLHAAVEAGWETEVVYVHRPFTDVVRAVIERSQRTGRWNNLRDLPRMHVDAQRTAGRLWWEFYPDVRVHAIYNAQQGVAEQPPGSRVLMKHLRTGGRYHHANASTLDKVIGKVLNQALKDGLVCEEVAHLIGPSYFQASRPLSTR